MVSLSFGVGETNNCSQGVVIGCVTVIVKVFVIMVVTAIVIVIVHVFVIVILQLQNSLRETYLCIIIYALHPTNIQNATHRKKDSCSVVYCCILCENY